MSEIVVHTTGMNDLCIRKICLLIKENKKEEAIKLLNTQQQSMLESIQGTNDMLDILKRSSPEAYEYAFEQLAMEQEEEENEDETSP